MANKYTDRIYEALDKAAPMELINGSWKLIEPQESHDLNLSGLKQAPDDHPIYLDINPARLPFCVPASTPEELAIILDEYLVINQEELSAEDRVLEIQHETEHGEAARLLGAKASNYALELHKSRDGTQLGWRLVHYPRGLKTMKIGLAVLNAYPREPVAEDLAQIRSLGYRDIPEVAELAKRYSLPIPLSARSQ
jgi:hypothetical protein